MIDSDRVPAALDSHTHSSVHDHHDAAHPLPILSNFQTRSRSGLSSQEEVCSNPALLDGRLLATDAPLLQELGHRHASSAPPAKRRHALPPQLTLAIPHQSDARNEWSLPVRSAGFVEGGAATQIHAEHSGVGAGYFSPPRSPDAPNCQSLPSLPPASKPIGRSRSGSIAIAELAKLSSSKSRTGAPKMVKERRSLQTLFIPSFLQSLQAQSTPLGLVPGPRVAAQPMPATANANNSPATSSGAEGNGSEGGKGERRRSFYGRRRSQTYAGGGSNAASIATSSSSASTSTLVPPLPVSTPMSDVYPPLEPAPGAPGGRESPSAYLLDDDPFAFAPAPLSPSLGVSMGSPTHSSAYTPLYSPPQSLESSRSPSMASLSSASTNSMPGTPTLHSFSTFPDEREREGTAPTSASSVLVPVPPPPTPASPLNPNPPPFNASAHDAQKPHMHTFRSLSATTSLPTLAHPHNTSPSASSSSNVLPHPPPVRAQPAHTRPAFAPRPSLPSLSTLSRMGAAAGSGLTNSFSFRGRKRKGKVGAGLPVEPWDLPAPEDEGEYEAREGREGEEELGEAEGDVEEPNDPDPSSTNHAIQSNVDAVAEAESLPTASPTSAQCFQSLADLQELVRVRQQEIESDDNSLMSRSSMRTEYETYMPTTTSPGAEEPSLGLRTYEGDSHAEVELDGYGELLGETRYDDEELGIDMKRADVASASRSDEQLTGWSPYEYQTDALEPGSSAGTLHPAKQQPQPEKSISSNSPPSTSPISTSDLDDLGPEAFDSPICEFQQVLEVLDFAPEGESPEDYADYYLDQIESEHGHEQFGESSFIELVEEEEEDSSMLPSLSTLPEDDPVFSLSPARSVSHKSSVATIASISSGRSGSSGRASQNSQLRGHSPAVSLSYSNSNSGSASGSYGGRRPFGSSSGSGSADFGRGGIAPSSSMTSLRSQSSADLRGLARVRRQGSESSGMSLLSRSSTRTKYEPHVPAKASPSVEELSLGLRAYEGNSYVEAELDTYGELLGKPSYDDEELRIDMRRADVATASQGDAQLTGWRPYDSQTDVFEPGSSEGTLRPRKQLPLPEMPSNVEWGTASMHARTHTNGYEYSGNRSGAGKEWTGAGGFGDAYGRRNGSSGSDYGQRGVSGGGRRGRGSGRDDDDEGRRRRKPDVASPPISTSESETDSESDSGTDDYGEESPGIARQAAVPSVPTLRAPSAPVRTQEGTTSSAFNQLRNGRKGVFRPPADSTADNARSPTRPEPAEDDDVPLAQRIPGALKAQKSIRQQVRSERDQRRRERSVAPTPRTSRAPEGSTSPLPQYLPVHNQLERGRSLAARQPKTAPLGVGTSTFSSSQEAAMMAARTLQPQPHHVPPVHRRARAKTLSNTGVPAEDLTKRLLKVVARDDDIPLSMHRTSATSPTQAHIPGTSYIREMTSMDRAQPISGTSRRKPLSPQIGSQPFHVQQVTAEASAPVRTLRPMRSFHGSSPATVVPEAAAPPIPSSLGHRHTLSRSRQPQDVSTTTEELLRGKSVKTPRTSMDKNARTSHEEAQILLSHHHHAQAPPVPPVPDLSRGSSPPAPSARHAVVQTRVYINDMQHFNIVEASVETSARDVLDMLRQQGDLRGEERRSSSWMLYEVCHDFGMERPVRSFELVTDISGSWNKEKTMNCFMVKQSPYASSLAIIPSSIPTRSGYVDYESKKGRWNKRWLELREHGLWLSKREGKDDEFLCSLSAFDAYVVTRIQKSSKSFSFAVKSTDPISLFENKADYLHVFSVPEETGVAWVESILLARSYILYQEKNVLFRNKNTMESTGLGSSAGTGLARSGTRKKPAQTYVTIPPPKVPGTSQQSGPFEPGSLLAKRSVS